MTPTQAAAITEAAAVALGEAAGDMIDAAVPAAKTAILDSVSAARGGSLTLSGMGATLGLADTVEESETTAEATLTATPGGPWAIVESGTKPHEQNRRGNMVLGSRAMKTPYGFKSHVSHPGAAGKGVWAPATVAAVAASGEAMQIVVDGLPSN